WGVRSAWSRSPAWARRSGSPSRGRPLRADPVERLLGLGHEPAHELARGNELLDGPRALPCGVALTVAVDAGCVLVGPEVEGPVAHRPTQLHREGLKLLGMVLPVPRVGVPDGAQRLARIGARDDGAVLLGPEKGVLVAGSGAGLGRGDEPRADPHAVGPESEGGCQPPPVEDAAGGDHGNARP